MITFRNDDEKHAWDLYVAGNLAGAGGFQGESVLASSPLIADKLLEARREREPQLSTEPRPRPGSGVDRA